MDIAFNKYYRHILPDYMMVEKAIVHQNGNITFVFYNGTEIPVESKAA